MNRKVDVMERQGIVYGYHEGKEKQNSSKSIRWIHGQ